MLKCEAGISSEFLRAQVGFVFALTRRTPTIAEDSSAAEL
jgi:hypothetical protein